MSDGTRTGFPRTGLSLLLPSSSSASWRGERVIGITGIDEISPTGQQVSNLVYRLGDRSARLAYFELALDLDESDVGGVQTGGEACCDVKRGRRICKQSRCVGDAKLGTFDSSHVGCMWPIQ